MVMVVVVEMRGEMGWLPRGGGETGRGQEAIETGRGRRWSWRGRRWSCGRPGTIGWGVWCCALPGRRGRRLGPGAFGCWAVESRIRLDSGLRKSNSKLRIEYYTDICIERAKSADELASR